ncbi:hypothetical protein VR43_14270, partial [Streptomyces sp. NRRL S-104]
MGGQPRGDSPLAFNAAGDHIFFIDGSGSVANDWVSNGAWAWQGPSGMGGQPRGDSPLAFNAAG